jgi:hypothetical protein
MRDLRFSQRFYFLGYNAAEKSTDVSYEHVASIFTVEKYAEERNQRKSKCN